MKDTRNIELKRIKDKDVFVDTVVLGIIFMKPHTDDSLKAFVRRSREQVQAFYPGDKTYIVINIENLPSKDVSNLSPF